MLMPGRHASAGDQYSYGFQGELIDDELKGEGNSINYRFRMHDPRLGRFFATDPLSKEYPYNSPYAFSENSTIAYIELEGLEKVVYYWNYNSKTKTMSALKNSKGDQIYGIYKDGTTSYHNSAGVFIDGVYEEFKGDVKNATHALLNRGKTINKLIYDDLDPLSEMWGRFKGTTYGKDFIQTIKNVGTVIGMVATAGTSSAAGTIGLSYKVGKVESIIDLGFSFDDLTSDNEGNTFISKKLSKDQKIFYQSVKLAFSGYQKVNSVKNLNKVKPNAKDFIDYLNSNYKVINGALELKEVAKKK